MSAPETGLISICALSASARKSLSASVSRKALRNASTRSAGMPGGARNGRPITWRAKISLRIPMRLCRFDNGKYGVVRDETIHDVSGIVERIVRRAPPGRGDPVIAHLDDIRAS